MRTRSQFEAWWEWFYETSPRESWKDLYSPDHDYYCDEGIDSQYDAWKAGRMAISSEIYKLLPRDVSKFNIIKENQSSFTDIYQQILNDEREE